MTGTRRAAPGFGLVEALVALMVLGILAAVLMPATAAIASAERVARSQRDLARVEEAVIAFEDRVRSCPANLDQLVLPLQPGDQDLLGSAYNAGDRNRWDGPYYHLALPAAGPRTGVGTITGLRLVSTTPDDVPGIVVDADVYDAAALDRAVDSGDGAGAGTVRWTFLTGDQVELEYWLALTCP